MYKKGVALEIQFAPERLNDGAGDPYWIDLTLTEAQTLLQTLQTQLARSSAGTAAPLVVSLDDTQGAREARSTDSSAAVGAQAMIRACWSRSARPRPDLYLPAGNIASPWRS